MRHKKFLWIGLSVIFVGTFAQLARAQEGPKKFLVAHAGLISTHASLWLAEDQGFFKRHGLDVTSVFTGSGSVTSQALVAGEAKLASTSVGPTAGAVAAGADLVIVAGLIHILPYQFWVDALLRVNPRMAKLKAADLVDNSFIERLEKSGYIQEAMKRSR